MKSKLNKSLIELINKRDYINEKLYNIKTHKLISKLYGIEESKHFDLSLLPELPMTNSQELTACPIDTDEEPNLQSELNNINEFLGIKEYNI